MTDVLVRTTCPRDCYDACGIVVTLRDGAIRNVRGDPDHPVARGRLCRKCSIGYNGVFLDPAARLTTPLVRSGAKGGGFRAASWDEALALVAGRLSAIVADAGPQTILNAHYTGTLALLGFSFGSRFFHRLGATEVDPDTVCNKAGHVALGYLYGTSETGFDPDTARDASCIVVWGANPSACGPHQDEHWLGGFAGPVVVIDPIRTPTAARADVHLAPRPGSDAALAFALLHELRRAGLVDRAYLEANAVGWDEVEPLLDGCSARWGERETGVPAAEIERVAHLYGRGPSLLWLGQGLQRQPLGGNVFRAVAMLPAVTGNLGRPGAGFCYLNGGRPQVDFDDLTGSGLGGDPPPPVSQMDLAEVLEDPARAQALVTWNINLAASNPQQARLRRALAREDLFCVALDVFPTDTTALADVVLPAAGFLEHDDLLVPYFDLALSAQVKVAEPPGEALPNAEIFRRLAGAMGYDEPELFEPDRAIIDRVIASTGLVGSFEELAAAGTVKAFAEPALQFADGVFPTPSGRIELASAAAEADGHPRTALPLTDAPPAAGRLRLLTPASPWTMNGTFANDPKVARRLGEAVVEVHPDEAAARGLRAGDRVVLGNETGSLALRLEVGEHVPPGVALSAKGRWPGREPQGANVNVLNDGRRTDMGESSAVHGVEVSLERAPQ